MELGDLLRVPQRRSRRALRLQVRLAQVAVSLGVTPHLAPLGQSEVDRLHSFRLLAHAEVQSFIEDVVQNALVVTEQMLDQGRKLTHAGHHLIVYSDILESADRRQSQNSRYPLFRLDQASVQVGRDPDVLRKAIKLHRKRVNENNGVKASNLRRLLMPVGFREYSLRPGLLDLLDAFGTARGQVAHATGVIGAMQLPSGSSELGIVWQILPGLHDLDNFAAKLLVPQ